MWSSAYRADRSGYPAPELDDTVADATHAVMATGRISTPIDNIARMVRTVNSIADITKDGLRVQGVASPIVGRTPAYARTPTTQATG